MSTNWDAMKKYEERIKELREIADEEGIPFSEESAKSALSFLADIQPAGVDPTEEPSRLLVHRETSPENVEAGEEDEWRIPTS